MPNIYKPLYDSINDGVGILTAGKIHDDIPTIHDVGHKLPTDQPVKHAGFGLFMATVGDSDINFDGGGAMNNEGDGETSYSWTRLYASREQLEAMEYPMDDVRAAINDLMNLGRIEATSGGDDNANNS